MTVVWGASPGAGFRVTSFEGGRAPGVGRARGAGMAEFSMQDAAFTGFRVVREHPRALIVWAIFALVQWVVLSGIFIAIAGPALIAVQADPQAVADPAQATGLLARLAPSYFLVAGLLLVSNSVLLAAMNRAVLRGGDDRLGFFRLGADERRQLGLQLLAFVVFIGVDIALVLAMVPIVILLSLVAPGSGGAGSVLFVFAPICPIVFLAVRFSLASALTFDGGRVNLFGSWRLTHGRFWPIFGTYLLAFALAVVVYMLSFLVIFAAAAMVGGGNPMTAMMYPDMTSLTAYLKPTRIVQMVLGAGVSALIWPLMLTPAAAIYRCLVPAAAAGAPV